MDPSIIRIIAGVVAVVLLGLIVMRRKTQHSAETE